LALSVHFYIVRRLQPFIDHASFCTFVPKLSEIRYVRQTASCVTSAQALLAA
jgi:hypothetical protein